MGTAKITNTLERMNIIYGNLSHTRASEQTWNHPEDLKNSKKNF